MSSTMRECLPSEMERYRDNCITPSLGGQVLLDALGGRKMPGRPLSPGSSGRHSSSPQYYGTQNAKASVARARHAWQARADRLNFA